MAGEQVVFADGQVIELPARTVAAIAEARAKYAAPLWQFRPEGVLKLGGHQWIAPEGPEAARAVFALHGGEIIGTAWKLFNRGWQGAAEAYWLDTARYPQHPRHLGLGAIPLVDEDAAGQQIGWVRILQATPMDASFAVFVQFALLDLFAARALGAEYGG